VRSEKPREIAVEILARRTGGDFVEALLDQALASTRLSPADRHLCQELAYGVVRWQATLDWLIGRKTDSRPQKPLLQNLLRIGLYQIFWLERIPNHAAVNETVELAKHGGFGAQTGFINAVLRGYLREFDPTKLLLAELKTTQPHLGYSHPEWLAARWQQRWGLDRTAQLMAWNNTPPRTFARVNTLKTDPAKLLVQWRDENVEYDFVRQDWFEENLVFELKSHLPLNRLPSFQQGLFYVQDPSTLLAVHELGPQPGESVLDLCAAPGGKLTFIAQLMRNQGRIVAHDTAPERLRLVQENCDRLGVTCVELGEKSEVRSPKSEGNPKPEIRIAEAPAAIPNSALRAPQFTVDDHERPASIRHPASPFTLHAPRSTLHGPFDRILLDAPCSNTGVMRRRVDLRWRIRPEEIVRLRAGQLELLRQAAPLLKPGGTLVYSTCSLEPEENRNVVNEFLSEQTGLKLERERELLPFVQGVDGAYVATFTKTG
jgi:16S rRNA (cytosine967-C5)-methyltransferase